MGARGPLKLPPGLRVVATGDKVEETAATTIRPSRPAKPRALPASVSKVWDQAVDSLDEVGLIAACDGPTLDLALRHYASAMQAHKDLMAKGPSIYDDKNDRWMKNPAGQIFRDNSMAFLEYAKVLGMAYGARARMSPPEALNGAASNPFDAPASG